MSDAKNLVTVVEFNLLHFINQHTKETGNAPTLGAIQTALRFATIRETQRCIDNLIRRGLIERHEIKILYLPTHDQIIDDTAKNFAKAITDLLPPLQRYARYLLATHNDRSKVDDLVQDTICRALSRQHMYQPATNLRAWLFTIMHNESVNTIRASVRQSNGNAVLRLDCFRILFDRPISGQDECLAMRDMDRALQALPEEQRTVVELIAFEGLRYEDVATKLKMPIGTVRSRLSRAREMLRKVFEGSDNSVDDDRPFSVKGLMH